MAIGSAAAGALSASRSAQSGGASSWAWLWTALNWLPALLGCTVVLGVVYSLNLGGLRDGAAVSSTPFLNRNKASIHTV